MVCRNVNNTINGEWTFAFYTVEGEIPALTAIQTESYSVVTIVLHFQCCILGVLSYKNALLQAKVNLYLNFIENAVAIIVLITWLNTN